MRLFWTVFNFAVGGILVLIPLAVQIMNEKPRTWHLVLAVIGIGFVHYACMRMMKAMKEENDKRDASKQYFRRSTERADTGTLSLPRRDVKGPGNEVFLRQGANAETSRRDDSFAEGAFVAGVVGLTTMQAGHSEQSSQVPHDNISDCNSSSTSDSSDSSSSGGGSDFSNSSNSSCEF